jgi:hypothetical protein
LGQFLVGSSSSTEHYRTLTSIGRFQDLLRRFKRDFGVAGVVAVGILDQDFEPRARERRSIGVQRTLPDP